MQFARLALMAAAALLLAACGTHGGMSGARSTAPGTATPASTPARTGEMLRGTVQSVDPGARSIVLSTTTSGGAEPGQGQATTLYYNPQTRLEYRGQVYDNPQNLEPGDQIDVQVAHDGGRLVARRIVVVSSVSDPGTAGAGASASPNAFDATVNAIQTDSRTIEVIQTGREKYPISVQYDANTRVQYQGRDYRPEDLERGDGVRIIPRGSGEPLIAAQIIVTTSASAVSAPARLRATIRAIDPNTRTISLDSISAVQGLDQIRPGSSARVTYGSNTVVEYRGQRYAVSNVEPGDVADIDLVPSGDGYLANKITVVQSR